MTHFKDKLIEAASSEYKMSKHNADIYLRKAMQAHTTQTLDRLKGKVEGLNIEDFSQMGRADAGAVQETVLQLIEEVSDE